MRTRQVTASARATPRAMRLWLRYAHWFATVMPQLCMRMLTVSNCLDFTDPDGDGTCNKTLGACDMIGNACFCCKLGCGCGGDLEKTKICCHGYCQSCCFVSDVSFPPDKTPPEGRPFLPFGIGLCGKMFTGGNKEGGAVMSESSDAVKGAAAQEMAR